MSEKDPTSPLGEGLPTLLEDTFLAELPDFHLESSLDHSTFEGRPTDFVFPVGTALTSEDATSQTHTNSTGVRWTQDNSTSTTLNEKYRREAFGDLSDYPSIRHRPTLSKDIKKEMSSSTIGGASLPPKMLIVDTNPWGYDTIEGGRIEDDDYLHDPDKEIPSTAPLSTSRGILNLGTLVLLILGILTLFAGYPIIAHFTLLHESKKGGFNLGGTNATGQVAQMPTNIRTDLIDRDTPDAAKTRVGFDGQQYSLVFSDEFNVDGRSFYPGDDPFWEALDLHYWATNNYVSRMDLTARRFCAEPLSIIRNGMIQQVSPPRMANYKSLSVRRQSII
ncbi:hypothetical protein MRB53_040668 [Persea americana]|nr:hypothetical protein MRB53_040668 [Persea americana]